MKYSEFSHLIDVDAFEEAIGYETVDQKPHKGGGTMDIGHCPDPWQLHKHGDLTGKFAILRDHRTYNCFVCGSGSLLSLAMAIKEMEEQEAREWLFQLTAPPDQSKENYLSEIDAILHQEKIAKPPLPYFNEHVLDKWTEGITQVESWLKDRGILIETAAHYRLGYDAQAFKMAPPKEKRPRESSYRGPAIIFPHFWGKRLVGWQQRWLDDNRPKWVQKYCNTGDFPKAETLYNYESVYLASRPIIVVESVVTALFLISFGYPAIATFGASLSEEQMRLLRLCQQGLVIAPDNDPPGRKWISHTEVESRDLQKGRKATRIILAQYLANFVPVKVIEPIGEYDSGDDLGDLMRNGSLFASKALQFLYNDAEFLD